jgi:hypothetical protein
VEKTNQLYVSPALAEWHSLMVSFDLCMPKGAYDVFALVINFPSNDWQPKHVTIGLFEAIETTWQALAKIWRELLDKYGLMKNIITYVKDEGFNFNAMIGALKSIVNCESFGLEESFQGICFGHVFSKACQYGIIEKFFCRNLNYVSIMSTQVDLQKCITWSKKSGKDKHEWNKACLETRIRPKKLNIQIKAR